MLVSYYNIQYSLKNIISIMMQLLLMVWHYRVKVYINDKRNVHCPDNNNSYNHKPQNLHQYKAEVHTLPQLQAKTTLSDIPKAS